MENPVALTIFVACFNEEENIVATLETVMAACADVAISYEILIIDDASTDRSVETIEAYQRAHPEAPIVMKVNAHNEGLGANFTEGAFLGRGKWYRLVCGDNVEDRQSLVQIFSRIGSADLLIPYHVDNSFRTPVRRFISNTYTGLINLITGHRIRYYNGLPVTLRYYVMRWHSNSHGFGFQADLIARLLDRGVSYLEIPVSGGERTKGESTAFTFKNVCSVANSLAVLMVRRFSKIVYGRA